MKSAFTVKLASIASVVVWARFGARCPALAIWSGLPFRVSAIPGGAWHRKAAVGEIGGLVLSFRGEFAPGAGSLGDRRNRRWQHGAGARHGSRGRTDRRFRQRHSAARPLVCAATA
jgi:hypothetical protein